jgi:folate-binding protein YgfZ
MQALAARNLHEALGAAFVQVNGVEMVAHYGRPGTEYAALRESAGVLDLSFRGRLCLTGNDRVRFLHGQVTNTIQALKPYQGCYAALVSVKGRMQSDLYVYVLPDELLLDFEPGLSQAIAQRLERHVVADDVQVVDVAPLYGLFSVQGPNSMRVVQALKVCTQLPEAPLTVARADDPSLGELYLVSQPRLGQAGFDFFAPAEHLPELWRRLVSAVKAEGGSPCGFDALETARIENGIPRFGADMDETNVPQEGGIDAQAVSYTKGCYIGQEVLNRIHTQGHVNRALRRFRFAPGAAALPARGDLIFSGGAEAGRLTSAAVLPQSKAGVALGYLRRTVDPGAELVVRTAGGDIPLAPAGS